jgi:hypothetical protein
VFCSSESHHQQRSLSGCRGCPQTQQHFHHKRTPTFALKKNIPGISESLTAVKVLGTSDIILHFSQKAIHLEENLAIRVYFSIVKVSKKNITL